MIYSYICAILSVMCLFSGQFFVAFLMAYAAAGFRYDYNEYKKQRNND